MAWKDYKDKYGRCEVESAPFECKICGRVVKYDRNTVHTHLKNVHGINWAMYLDRIRRMRRGEIPEDLPAAQTHECRVCNVSVKYLKEHLKNAHKITEQEYESLFENDDQNGFDMKHPAAAQPAATTMPKPPPLTPKPQLPSAKIPRQPTPEVMLPLVQAHDPSLPKPPKSDIQDKTNKTCSSCTITFDSRRSFIEHCTTVHNMRFKTKSGVTISNNTVQKRLAEEALKRSKEAEEQQQQVPVKSQQPLEDGSIIGKFIKPLPPLPLPQLKQPQEIHAAYYDHYHQEIQEGNFTHQEIHAENLGEIHAVQEMQVFENSITEEALSLPKIKNIFSASIEKTKASKSKKESRVIMEDLLLFKVTVFENISKRSHFTTLLCYSVPITEFPFNRSLQKNSVKVRLLFKSDLLSFDNFFIEKFWSDFFQLDIGT